MAKICVFCSSCDEASENYKKSAEELGRLIGERGHDLVYGGSNLGLMGITARAAQKAGGKAIGVLPEIFRDYANQGEDELHMAEDMRHRKAIMEIKSDAFIALPGGFGTLCESIDIIEARLLDITKKPFVIVNTDNFYEDLLKFFDKIYKEKLVYRNGEEIYHVVASPKEAMDFIESELASHLNLKI
jgi:cytokinin riboside 5'-monophosphate phosphoribohydrolase